MMMMITTSYSEHCVQLAAQKVTIIKQPNDHHRARLRLSLGADSAHVREYWTITPPDFNTQEFQETTEEALSGPAVELNLSDFLADSRKFATNHDADVSDEARRHSLLQGYYDEDHDDEDHDNEYRHHGATAALISGLGVGDETRSDILHCLIVRTDWLIEKVEADLGGGDRFDLDVTVNLRVMTETTEVLEAEEDAKWMVPAAEEAIEGLGKVRFGDLAIKDDNQRPCVVCCEGFKGESLVTRLECCHVFHCECLFEWLEKSHYCPLCRFELPIRDS